MSLLGWMFGSREQTTPVRVLSCRLDNVFVRTKVDGVGGLVSVADLVRSYQKNRHADNRMREAAAIYAAACSSAAGAGGQIR